MAAGRLCRPDCRAGKPDAPRDFKMPRQFDRPSLLRATWIPAGCADGDKAVWPPYVIDELRATAAAVEAAILRVLSDTLAETHRQTGFSRAQLARLRDDFLARFAARHRPSAGRVMAADGVACGRGEAAIVVVELRRRPRQGRRRGGDDDHVVVGVVGGYTSQGFAAWLVTLLAREGIEAVVIDRCVTLRAGIHLVFPKGGGVVIVCDRAHLHRNVADCVLRALRAAGVAAVMDHGDDGDGALRDQVAPLFEKSVEDDYQDRDWQRLLRLEDQHRRPDGSSPVSELWQINQHFRQAVRQFDDMRGPWLPGEGRLPPASGASSRNSSPACSATGSMKPWPGRAFPTAPALSRPSIATSNIGWPPNAAIRGSTCCRHGCCFATAVPRSRP